MHRMLRFQGTVRAAAQATRTFHSAPIAAKATATFPIQLTKIVATIGPASEQLPMLPAVVEAGMRIMRINFSHATYDEADLRMTNLKLSNGITSPTHNLRAVMLDTQGPEIRTGSFGSDGSIELVQGAKVALTTDETHRTVQTEDMLWVSYAQLMDTVSEGSVVLLDDGAVELSVKSLDTAAGLVRCEVVNTGTLGSRKGVNLPNAKVQLPAMSDKDRQDIRWGIQNDVDYIAVSFVRKPQDLHDIRAYVSELQAEFGLDPATNPQPKLISKIESTEAMDNFDSILEASDAIMVARGDLGVEIPMEQMAGAQKDIVRKSNMAGKPVIVATQMLETMQKNPRPTRAECTDVANAVYDGADCVMLSGESAKGKYPVGAVQMMNKIIGHAEQWGTDNDVSVCPLPAFGDSSESIATGAAEASRALDASCIIVLAKSGATAQAVHKFRPNVPVVTFVPSQKAGRMLQLHRGVHPVLLGDTDKQARILSADPSRFSLAVEHATSLGFCVKGDKVIIVAAEQGDEHVSTALSMRIVTVK